jgi:molybdopterin adenylyltransferase
MITVGIITVSDRAARGEYTDQSGPALRAACEQRQWSVTDQATVPDEIPAIQETIRTLAAKCQLVLLTGGTGVAARDVTPEAVRALPHRELPGFGEVMRAKSFANFPHAILSRSLAVTMGSALVMALPGSPRGAVECLEFVAAAIPHAVELLAGQVTAHQPG